MPKFTGLCIVSKTYDLPIIIAKDAESAHREYMANWELLDSIPASVHMEIHAEKIGNEPVEPDVEDSPPVDDGKRKDISDTTIDDILGNDKQ